MIDALTRSLGWYDPQLLGETQRGTVLGLTQTLGETWPGLSGCHVLYASPDGSTTVDYADGAIGATDGSAANKAAVSTWPGVFGANETRRVALRAISPGGVEDANDTQVVTIETDGDGVPVVPVPNPPILVTARPVAGGKIALTWAYSSVGQQAQVASWNIYHDNGTGTVSYASALGSASSPAYLTAAYSHGTAVIFVVRSATADGDEEANTNEVTATADAEGPEDIGAPTISAGRES